MEQGVALSARREVILCAGTYEFPAILLRSGIGDGRTLTSLNIPVVHDTPEVGRNLQEHTCASIASCESDDNTLWTFLEILTLAYR